MGQHSRTATMLLGGLDGRNHRAITQGRDAADTGNYRGVTLGSHLGKLFCQILKSRLENVVESRVNWEKRKDGSGETGRQ